MKKNNIYVSWFKSKQDIQYNLEKYQKQDNILFITGLVGSGKSTLARKLAKEYNATIVIQDYLAWSECYDNKECTYFVKRFQQLYPETTDYFEHNEWREKNLTSEQKNEYRRKFDKMVVDFAKEHQETNFIYEGNDLFCSSDINLTINKPIIIKRTGAILSFVRSFKRGNKDNNTLKEKLKYLKRMRMEFKRFYIKDLPKLNKFISLQNNK